MAPSTKFWDNIADKYAKQPITDEAAYAKKLQAARDYFQPRGELDQCGFY